jgi:hypothetical protein
MDSDATKLFAIGLSMGDAGSKRVMLHVAAGYKRLAERAELQNAKRYVDGSSFGLRP